MILGGWKQYKFIIIQFWRLEIQNGSGQKKKKKNQMSTWLHSFLEALRENLFPDLFQLLQAIVSLSSWPLVPSSKSARMGQVLQHCHFSWSFAFSSIFKTCGYRFDDYVKHTRKSTYVFLFALKCLTIIKYTQLKIYHLNYF